MKRTFLFALLLGLSSTLFGQEYFGAGISDGIIVTASDESGEGLAVNSINGKGMDAKLFEVSRFLSQATLGVSMEEINALSETMDFEGFIDEEILKTGINYSEQLDNVWSEVYQHHIDIGTPEEDIYGPGVVHFNYAWFEKLMNGEDKLKQKMANALSEIVVISFNNNALSGFPYGISDFYDILYENAFGNFQDILLQASLHPSMGSYLSHFDNPKAIPEEEIHPDENYAREIMQLFSIGLYELNLNGTRKKDADGNDIPTYNNNDVKELAKVFTGLSGGAVSESALEWIDEPFFGMGFYTAEKTTPMVMYQEFHETSEKTIFGDLVIPANQPGMQDIEETVDYLFNHDNVGPFLAFRLIQRFVKSNPTPSYVERVASVFNDNGSGVRGDLGAVVKAILLDTEARDCDHMQSPTSGRLRPPMTKMTQISKGIALNSPLGRYWHSGYQFFNETWHLPMYAPSVFNFYLPDHSPAGDLANAGIFAPEYKMHNTQTATSYINLVANWSLYDFFFSSWEDQDPSVSLNKDYLATLASEPEKLINYLDILLAVLF